MLCAQLRQTGQTRLPGEEALCARYGYSRQTVRKALAILEEEGLLIRVRGSGTYLSASYGMTDTMGRMHSDAQFAGSSSVPAHVEMMGLIGMGNNPMVGATVAVAVSVEEAMKGK